MPDAATPSPEPTPQSTAEVAARTCPELVDGDVRLRLHTPADVPAVVATSNDPVTVHWTTVPQPYDEGAAAWWVGHMHEGWALRAGGDASGVMGWAVDARDETGQWVFAGQVEVRPIGGGVGEMGLVLHPDHRGRGLMVPAAAMAMRWATEHGGLRVLHWKAAVGNWASRRTGWRLGYRFSDAVPGLMPQERATFDGWIGTWEAGEPIEPRHPWHTPSTLDVPSGTDATGRELPAVRLRAWEEGDRPTDPEPDPLGDRFMPGMMPPADEAGYDAWLTRQRTRMATGEMVAWAIVDPATDRVGGYLQLGRLGHPFYPGTASVGYSLYPRARGRGLLHAALVALADHAFTPAAEGGLGLARLEAGCEAGNRGSAEALRRAGFGLVGIERASSGRREDLQDGYLFELLNDAEVPDPTGGNRPNPPAPRPAAVTRARDARVLTAPTLAGERVVLREWREEDLPALADAFARGSLGEYTPDADGTRRWVQQRRERMLQGTDVVWGVVGAPGTEHEGQVLGGVNAQKLADRFAPHAVEIGYWTHVDHRGKGVLGEALELLIEHVMAPVADGGLGRTQVDAVTHDDNHASMRVLQKAGFRKVGGRAAGAAAPQAGPGAEAADGQRTPGFVDWRLDAGDDRAAQARRTEEERRHPAELTASTAGGEALTLSALTTDEADLARVVEACRDPESVRWLGGTGRIHAGYSPTDAREYAAGLALGALTGSCVGWAVRDADGQVLGMIDVQGIGERNEIGYWVHPGARRRGVVSAALQALTRHALAPREAGGMGLARLTIRHAAGNTGSRRAIEAAGFHRIGTARRQEPIGDGTVVDHELYDLLPEDLEG